MSDLTLQWHKSSQSSNRKYVYEIIAVITWRVIIKSLLFCQRAEQGVILLKNNIAAISHRI